MAFFGEFKSGCRGLVGSIIAGLRFFDNILSYIRGDVPEFRTQIRRTLLHEIGHYLGLDEDEVDQREL